MLIAISLSYLYKLRYQEREINLFYDIIIMKTFLKANGVTILDNIEEFGYGKFVHIMDLEGTKIELWEPIDSFFTKMGGETTK